MYYHKRRRVELVISTLILFSYITFIVLQMGIEILVFTYNIVLFLWYPCIYGIDYKRSKKVLGKP